jgi:hypothetical protein
MRKNDQLPVFNYGDSFDMQLNSDQRSFTALNDAGRAILVPVDVHYGAYMPIKEEMLSTLRTHMKDGNRSKGAGVTQSDAQLIVKELSDLAT